MTREKNICFLEGNRVVVKGPSYLYNLSGTVLYSMYEYAWVEFDRQLPEVCRNNWFPEGCPQERWAKVHKGMLRHLTTEKGTKPNRTTPAPGSGGVDQVDGDPDDVGAGLGIDLDQYDSGNDYTWRLYLKSCLNAIAAGLVSNVSCRLNMKKFQIPPYEHSDFDPDGRRSKQYRVEPADLEDDEKDDPVLFFCSDNPVRQSDLDEAMRTSLPDKHEKRHRENRCKKTVPDKH